MALRRRGWGLPGLLMMALLAAACEKPAPESENLIRPVRAQQVFSGAGERTRVFSGVAQAGQQIELSFKVAGSVRRVAVKMGDRVKAGDLVAELDAKDILLEMEEAEAALARQRADARNAAANYARIEALYEANNAALAELDAALAQNETAQAAVRSAEKGLQLARRRTQYTRLSAPLDGAIAEKLISANENVQAGQTVLRLNSGSQPEVLVTIPEVLITQIEAGDDVAVRFDALPGRNFAAKVLEVGVAATGGATFPVTVRLTENQTEIRPGMAAEVAFVFAASDDRPHILAPAKAIGEDIHGKFAFVALPTGNGLATAKRVAVTTGALTAEGLEVIEGLSDGDFIQTMRSDLPSGVVGPEVNTDFGDVYPIMLSITGDGYSYAELKTVADKVRDDLLRISDVAKVEIYGAQEERIFVEYNNARLAEVGLSPQQLKSILEARNIIQSGGSIISGGEEIVLEPTGNFESVADLKRTLIQLPHQPEVVYLRDLARVTRGTVDPPTEKMNTTAVPCLGLSVSMIEGGNVIRLGENVKHLVAGLPAIYPVGVDFHSSRKAQQRVLMPPFTAPIATCWSRRLDTACSVWGWW